jgi:DNA repair protein RadC
MAPYAEAELIEVMWGLALDSQSNVREITELSRGCLNSTIVTPGLVFGWACSVYAAGIILVHNHPSGDPTPSPEDRTITAQLVRASEIIDIPLYDHLIIGSNGRFNAAAASGWL